ncbi:hypothetical protein ACFQ6Q_26470 [Streptomyces sp. NPDC056437]|uniref:hypothetical protein n=1 Tax=Streptomyces sp. NPDC056437 TaxID=3345816 RepID=UPI003686B521
MPHTSRRSADLLLAAIEPLPYPLRMRELSRWTRKTEPGERRSLLAELDARGPYERGLAVVVASVGGETGWIGERLADPDAFVRGQALRVAAGIGVPDEAFAAALDDAPAAIRRQLLRAVVSLRRTALADRLVDGVRETWGDTEAARLLPGCGQDTVARLLPALFHAVRGWTSLGRRHPGPVLDAAERELAALPESLRDGWWQRYARAVAATADAEPRRVLALFESMGPAALPVPLSHRLAAVAKADPARVVRMLLAPEGHALRGRVSRCPALLAFLARHAPEDLVLRLGRVSAARPDQLARLIAAHPPARRGAFHEAVVSDRGSDVQVVNAELLDVLPRSCVAVEARRMADRARERSAPWSEVLLAESYLPVDEARERLVAATRRPAAEDRAEAWPLLVRNAARSGYADSVTAVLREMARLRNEQDPVRSAALDALAATPPMLFTEEAEDHLDRVAADAVEARDSSPATRQALSRLAVEVLREHAATGRRGLVNWALRTVVRISGSTGGADLGRLDRTLRRGQEHDVFEALRPWIEAGAEKADFSLAFALARAAGRRAAGMPELQELLWQAVRFGNSGAARTAVDLWLEPPRDRDRRVELLLSHERSAAVLPPVVAVLTSRRTDLLDRILEDTPPYGRFLAKDSHWTLPVNSTANTVHRWTARQQRSAVRQLANAADDTSLPLYTRADAIASVARIPAGGADVAHRWTGSHDVVLTETALAALTRTVRPADALPELLSYANGDRARVAVYAVTRASRYARPSELGALLRGVLEPGAAKVTSRKEAVRLAAARLPLIDAAGVLADTYAMKDQHRDVRAACVAFAPALLGDERMWRLLTDASTGERVLRDGVLRVVPMDLPESYRPRYARLIRGVCEIRDKELAGTAFAALAHWLPWSPEASVVLVSAITDLSDRRSWYAAADALAAAAVHGPEAAAAVEHALTRLATADALAVENADDAGAERDRPARRRVEHLTERLCRRSGVRPRVLRPVQKAAAELLAGHDTFVPQATALLTESLDLAADADSLRVSCDRLVALHEDRPALAVRTADALGRRLRGADRAGDAAALLTAARQLAEAGGRTEGLLAVTLTAAGGERTSWTEPWRAQLRRLRRHQVADVRDAALGCVTAHE